MASSEGVFSGLEKSAALINTNDSVFFSFNYLLIEKKMFSSYNIDDIDISYLNIMHNVIKEFDVPPKNYVVCYTDLDNTLIDFFCIEVGKGIWIMCTTKMEILYNSESDSNLLDRLLEFFLKCQNNVQHYKKKENSSLYSIHFDNIAKKLQKRASELGKVKWKLEDNYNDDLAGFHKFLINGISDKNKQAFYLLFGEKGTGKTFYLKYLISKVQNLDFYFIPLSIIENFCFPDFVTFFIENPGAVLIIEDCEMLLKSREKGNVSAGIVNLLNICDGLLRDAVKSKVICTFNGEVSDIDKALLRKGRLTGLYHFRKLKFGKALQLSQKLKRKNTVDGDTLLSELYYDKDIPVGKRIGY